MAFLVKFRLNALTLLEFLTAKLLIRKLNDVGEVIEKVVTFGGKAMAAKLAL